jgi:hypothetical protein
MEMFIGFFFAIAAFLLVSMTKRRWLAWVMAGLFVVACCFTTGVYFHTLNSPAFPEAFLDDSGRAWKAMCRRIQEDDRIEPERSLPKSTPATATQPSQPLPPPAAPKKQR